MLIKVNNLICQSSTILKDKFILNRNYSTTIYALSSGLLNNVNKKTGVAIAVIRISGSQTINLINSLTNNQFHKFKPREAKLTNLYSNNELIDKAIAIWFPKVS